MSGPCCQFCGLHCFVLRRLPGDAKQWAGQQIHMATCVEGMSFDFRSTGYTAHTAMTFKPVTT